MPGPLDDVRVVEACGLIGHYAGCLLANLGADVVKVEPPEGDVGRSQPPFLPGVPAIESSLPFLLHNANKRGVSLDLATAEGQRAFLELLAGADVLLESWTEREQRALGIGDGEIEATAPALVRTSITGWGRSGPRACWASADIVACAMSGVMRLVGFPEGPPEQLPEQQALRCASIQAAAGTLAALLHRDETGAGQLVEVSMQEALLMAMETAVCTFDILGTDRERTGLEPSILRGANLPGYGLYQCRRLRLPDGHRHGGQRLSGPARADAVGRRRRGADGGALRLVHRRVDEPQHLVPVAGRPRAERRRRREAGAHR